MKNSFIYIYIYIYIYVCVCVCVCVCGCMCVFVCVIGRKTPQNVICYPKSISAGSSYEKRTFSDNPHIIERKKSTNFNGFLQEYICIYICVCVCVCVCMHVCMYVCVCVCDWNKTSTGRHLAIINLLQLLTPYDKTTFSDNHYMLATKKKLYILSIDSSPLIYVHVCVCVCVCMYQNTDEYSHV